MNRIILLAVLSFFISKALADGPPMDSTGNIRGKYISIKLDSVQIAHLQTHRWLKLTPAQRKRLHFLDLPKYIDILDPFYKDCVCGMIYGMWYKHDEIAFSIRDTTIVEKHTKNDEEWFYYNNDKFIKAPNKHQYYIGSDGQLYHMNKPIDLSSAQVKMKNQKVKPGEEKFVLIYQTPSKNNPGTKTALKIKKELAKRIPKDVTAFWL